MSKGPLSQQLAAAEARVRREVLWFAEHASPYRMTELQYAHAVRAQQAIIERDRLLQMIRQRNAEFDQPHRGHDDAT